jgi:integrase
MERENKAQRFERQIKNALPRLSAANRGLVEALIAERRRSGIRPSSNYSLLIHLLQLDTYLKGRPFKDATPDELRAFLDEYAITHASTTTRLMAIWAQTVLVRALDLDDTDDLPRPIRHALRVARTTPNVRGHVIPEKDFLAAVAAVPRLGYVVSYATELLQAVLWLLWDTGMRRSELLSLRVSDVTFHDESGTARLQLREELTVTHGLKTGARYVIVRDAVPALKAWLAVHPGRLDPEAPLIIAIAYYRHPRPMNDDSLNKFIERVFNHIGAHPPGGRRHYSAHDFRHTAATRDAQQGYREPHLRLKYGWSGNSSMPAHYVHLNEADARARVLATTATGQSAAPPATPMAALVEQLMAALAAAQRGQTPPASAAATPQAS